MKKEYQQLPSYPLRLEPEVRTKLEAIAKANGRSLNTQITMILEAALQGESLPLNTPTDDNNIESIARRVALEVVREELAKAGLQLDRTHHPQ